MLKQKMVLSDKEYAQEKNSYQKGVSFQKLRHSKRIGRSHGEFINSRFHATDTQWFD